MGSRAKSVSSHSVLEIPEGSSSGVKQGTCNLFQWVDEDFEGGEGESSGGGQCNCSKILVETLTTKIGILKRKMVEERRKVQILKAIVVALSVLLSAVLLVEVGYFK
ncbi:competence protein [Sesbania bispinosa]|nr:competence protein [Sesbania bispinosa]